VPTKYKQATKKDWEIRRLIWDFKDGKRSLSVAKLVAEKLIINVPVAVGVPVIAPVEVFKVKPVGKAPLVMA
jgi:hypothetical protein